MSMSGNPLSFAGGNTPFGNFPASLPGFLQGFFGDSGAPYKKAGQAYLPYYKEAQGYQNPFYKAGTDSIPDFQKWIQGMGDPSHFINNLMGQYQESPFAKFQQQQGIRAGTNAASASGLTGSTPFAQQLQQNAQNISSQDMNQWLQNVLGINTQYGQGLDQLIGRGQHAADMQSGLAQQGGEWAGNSAYGREAGKQQDRNSIFGAIGTLFGG